MATAQSSPAPPTAAAAPAHAAPAPAAKGPVPGGAGHGLAPALPAEASEAQGLLPVSPLPLEEDRELREGPVARLPVELDVTVPVGGFRVRHLLALEPGRVIESQWNGGEDVPLAAGQVQLGWSEFEVIDSQLAVRITRLP